MGKREKAQEDAIEREKINQREKQPAEAQLAFLPRICILEPFELSSSFVQWLVLWHCSSKEHEVPTGKCNNVARFGKVSRAGPAVFPRVNASDRLSAAPAIVSTRHTGVFHPWDVVPLTRFGPRPRPTTILEGG